MSRFGRWIVAHDLPAFRYEADHETIPEALWDPRIGPPTRRHWVMVGNRALQLQAANDGTVAVYDERYGQRWLTAPDPGGTGVSVVEEESCPGWGSEFARRPSERTFGPTWFSVRVAHGDLDLDRLLLLPEGEVPWVLVRVRLSLAAETPRPRRLRHREQWALRPRFLTMLDDLATRRARALAEVAHEVHASPGRLVAAERFSAPLIGPPATLVLEALGDTAAVAHHEGAPHATLELATDVALVPGETRTLWFRFGRLEGTAPPDPEDFLAASRVALEIPWHAALLTGGAARDVVIGGHTLNQASTYAFEVGFNGAARDPLQHALPLVYAEPDLALSVLRNTCAWATPEGDLPYALDGAKQPTNLVFRPSDQSLWALWLAAEYSAATGDLAAFDEPLAYHPARAAAPVPLREHLRRLFRFFVDEVGRGAGGHVRILNADWNDAAIPESGVPAADMIRAGGSVLNSAMAAWVLDTFAGLAERLGEPALAAEARAIAADLRLLVAAAWNGRWFQRAYGPDGSVVGERDCWLEVQPWAILCGAATAAQAGALLRTIDEGHRAGSPLGARVRWPVDPAAVASGTWGSATRGGIWYSINMTLVWAAARVNPELGWDEWRRMSLASHTRAYPGLWEGTLSGPDAWNAPEAATPGRTWFWPPHVSMQAFPVNNLHSHAQPLLAYLRLLGVEPTGDGALATGGGGRYASRSFTLETDGGGRLEARGPVVVAPRAGGRIRGGPGTVRW